MNDQPVSRKTFDEAMVPCFAPSPFVTDRREGSRVWDTEGRDCSDFACGIAVTSLIIPVADLNEGFARLEKAFEDVVGAR